MTVGTREERGEGAGAVAFDGAISIPYHCWGEARRRQVVLSARAAARQWHRGGLLMAPAQARFPGNKSGVGGGRTRLSLGYYCCSALDVNR